MVNFSHSLSGRAPKRRTLRVITSLALVGSLALAACGDDDSSSGGSDDTTADSAGPAPTGDPIKVHVSAPVDSPTASYPNIKAAAEIYESYINDNGGIGGRPLEMTFCDSKADPNEAAACARKAVDDGAIAMVGGYDIDVSLLIEFFRKTKPLGSVLAVQLWMQNSRAQLLSTWVQCSHSTLVLHTR